MSTVALLIVLVPALAPVLVPALAPALVPSFDPALTPVLTPLLTPVLKVPILLETSKRLYGDLGFLILLRRLCCNGVSDYEFTLLFVLLLIIGFPVVLILGFALKNPVLVFKPG